jgi:hypothetical protein
MKQLFYFLACVTFISCNDVSKQPKAHYPNRNYQFVSVDEKSFNTIEQYYVPVYSSIYGATGKHEYYLTATLSIRNIGYTDSLYLSKIYYYDSNGNLLKKYLDSTALLKPMASMEIVIPTNEKEGGAGANFVVECLGNNILNEPLIQTVMTTSDLRVGFTANAVKIKIMK